MRVAQPNSNFINRLAARLAKECNNEFIKETANTFEAWASAAQGRQFYRHWQKHCCWAGSICEQSRLFVQMSIHNLVATVLVIGFPGLAWASSVTPTASSSPALSARIGEAAALEAVDMLLVPDHLFMKSATAVSGDYLERVADRTSRFYPDYLEYTNRQISRSELIARLPHVAMIGDSLSKNAYISSIPSTFWRARTERRRDWFLDTDPSPASVYSVFERLDKLTPLVATEYSAVGALVDDGTRRANFFRRLVRTRNFSEQVSQIITAKRFPDLVLIWIGHNNVDWAAETQVDEREHPERRLRELARKFRADYARQMERLISGAQTKNHKVAVVVFGLVNFEAFFKAREAAESLRAADRHLYPYLEVDYKHFVSMRPAYRANMIRFALIMNEELRGMVNDLNREMKYSPNVQLRYSDALANVDISRVELIHAMDAWHPSVKGHNLLAETAFDSLSPSLEFLGIDRKLNSLGPNLAEQRAGR
jgi:lysophospholipase L1-like esterase